jgi:predicted transcriptional regulator
MPGVIPPSYNPESSMNFLSRGNALSDRTNPKTQAREIVEALPDSATWEDLMYEFYVREAIEKGLADVENGRSIPHEEVRTRLRELLRRAS